MPACKLLFCMLVYYVFMSFKHDETSLRQKVNGKFLHKQILEEV